MKQNLLFVDDELMVLNGLKRMLHSMREEWDMDFVDRGDKALELMRKKPMDVIVSDMRMPGMNGAELLSQVQEEFPQTIRLILSGYSDQDLILKSLGCTHQYLTKPCNPDDLKSTINRAISMKQSVDKSQVMEIVSRLDKIPSLPTLYLEIVEKLKDPDSDISEIAQIIRRDIGMTTNVLKLVNSSFFGLGRKVTDTEEAVTHLGLKRVKELVLVVEFFTQYPNAAFNQFSPDALWKHCMDVAVAAKLILEMEAGSRKDKEAAFVSGMLHDVGKLILCSNFPDEYSTVLQTQSSTGESLLKREREGLNTNHAEVGSYLLGLWGLDEPIVSAIALHHNPRAAFQNDFDLTLAVHVADVLTNENAPSNLWSGSVELDEDYLAELGLIDRVPVWREALLESQTLV